MSCDWNIYCKTCNDEHSFDDANHQKELMVSIIESAEAIAALVPLLETERVELKTRYGYIDPKWFKKHLGHELVPRSEYGDF